MAGSGKSRIRLGAALLGVVTVAALLAPVLSPVHPDAQRDVVATRFLAPLSTDRHQVFHPLGTDRLGRDVWARLLYGARVSLSVGVGAAFINLTIGLVLGLAAGYSQGWLDDVVQFVINTLLSVPTIPLLLIILLISGSLPFLTFLPEAVRAPSFFGKPDIFWYGVVKPFAIVFSRSVRSRLVITWIDKAGVLSTEHDHVARSMRRARRGCRLYR